MNVIKHRYGKRTVSLLLAVILVLCPLRVRAADNKPTIGIGDYIKSAQDPYVVSAPDAPDYSIGISGAVRDDVNGDWNVNTDEYLQLEMSRYYTEDSAYADVTVPVYTIQKPRSDKENMVIVYCAEGYTKSQQKQFIEDVKRLWGEVLKIEPYRSMADRFNVYALCTASVDGYGGTSTFFAATAKGGISTNKGNWRNHVLERIIGPAFIEKIHDAHIPNETHPNENTMDHNYRQYDYVYENINQFVVLANSGEYFGGSHDNKQYGIHYIVASARNAYSAFTQRHELGHGLFHLGDEYNYSTVPVDEWNYTTSLNMTATKDPTKVKWKQLLGFRNTYTCPHLDYYPYTYNSSRDCLMRETFQNDFCDVCKLQGIKVMSQLITNPPALYVAVPEVKKYIGGYRNPTKDPSAFEAANSSAYASYQNDRNSRLLSGGSKNSFDYSSMKGQQVELRTIIQNLSNTQAKTVTLRLWVEHSNGEKAVTTDGEQVFTTQEFDIPVWKEKSKFWTKGALDYEGSDFNSGLVNCSLVYTIPENAILQFGDTIGFEIVDHATGEVLADDDTEQQRYVNVTIQYQLEDGTDVPNTMPTTFTVPVGKKVDWRPPQELNGYTFVQAEGMEEPVPSNGMTIRYIYKRTEERPEPPVIKITPPQAITVANGTAYGDMNLPDKVNIVTKGNTVSSAPVTWDTNKPASGSYDPSVLQEQTVTLNGKVTCPDGIDANGVPLTTTITITIRAAGIVEAPTANPTAGTYTENQSVELTSSTKGAKIYYTTDGSEPTITGGTQYTAPISVKGKEGQSITTTIKAIAVKDGMQNSSVETFAYNIKIKDKLTSITAPDAITVANGTAYSAMNLPKTVNIKTEGNTESSAPVTWDTDNPADGSYDPSVLQEQTVTLNGKVTCPESIDDNGVPLTTTITITISAAGIVGAPTANPTAGIYSENQSVELKSTTADATIYYTTDGSEPTITTGTPGGTTKQYTAPISVTGIEGQSNTTTIKAIAVKNDLQDSKVETFAYTIQIPEATYTVTVTNGSGTGEYAQGETVKITAGAAPGGQQFKEWEVVSGTITLASSTSETTTFTMPAEAVSVKANYEATAKDSITSVKITGIDAPKANTTLDTSAACAIKGVSSTTPKITWTPGDTKARYNTRYTASVTLTAATGYEFSNSTTATINGKTATNVKKNTNGTLTVTYKFPATAKDSITSVKITGIDAPKANTTLDTSAACAIKGVSSTTPKITWTPGDTKARYNTRYTASVTLTAATGYEFSNSTTATINGKTATNVKKNTNGTLTVTYKFPATAKPATAKDSMINYETHVQTYGWQGKKSEGQISGTSGESKRLEGIRMHLTDTGVAGGVTYRTHVQTYGWQNWKSDGEVSGTSGQSKRLEAIQIKLTGEMAEKYDIYYRVHAQTYGWLGWSKNGEAAGTEGLSKRLEAIQIRLEEKGHPVDGSTANSFVSVYTTGNVRYRTHVQSYGWQGYVSDGKLSGTSGQSKRLEGINISLSPNIDGGITYRTHVQTYGWQKFVSNGTMAGTSGQSKRLEAIEIKLTGNAKKVYDVYYRVHCQHFGWLGWAKNGESAGSAGYGYRLEAIQIQLVKKGGPAPGSTSNAFLDK